MLITHQSGNFFQDLPADYEHVHILGHITLNSDIMVPLQIIGNNGGEWSGTSLEDFRQSEFYEH